MTEPLRNEKRKQVMAKKVRTQAMRMLDARKIPYTAHIFPETIHDAMQVAAAMSVNADLIVTRNVADYRHTVIPALTPHEFLRRLTREK